MYARSRGVSDPGTGPRPATGPTRGVAHAPAAITSRNSARHRTPRADVTFAPPTECKSKHSLK
jgi:hypothetical protein